MRGAVELAVEYAQGRRQYGQPIGSFQAVQHLLADAFVLMEGSRSAALHAAWAVDALAADDAVAAAALAKAYCARSARTCARPRSRSTAASATRGSAWPTSTCAARSCRATCSAAWGPTSTGCSPTTGSEASMDFGDSPEEAEFRLRLREWLVDNDPKLPTSSTDDAYWAGQAAWHQSLYDGGFFGTTWSEAIGGRELPERLRRHHRRGAGPRRRPAPAEPRLPGRGHPRARQRRDPGPLPARHRERARAVVPGVQRARRRLRPGVAAHPGRARRRRVRHPRPQGLDQLLRRRRLVPRAGPHRPRRARSTRASRPSPCPWTSRASSSDRCR